MITALAGPGSIAGGVWEVVVNQSVALLASGHEVSIAAGWLGENPPCELRGLPVELVSLQQVFKPFGLRGLVGRGWGEVVNRALGNADIAHIHLCRDFQTTFATRSAQTRGLPIIAQTHGMLRRKAALPLRLFDRAVTLPALRRVDHFITLTDAEKPRLGELGVRAHQMTTIENAVPDPQRTWKSSGEPARLLFVSRLHPRKQVLAFAEVVAGLRATGVSVQGIVAGPDEGDLPRLREFIRTHEHGGALRYIGEIDRHQLIQELQRATALVFPARDEPFGLVLIEAMSVGTPIVSTNQTPLAQVIDDASAALTTAPDVPSLMSATRRVLDDARLRSDLSRNGRLLYLANWTNHAMVDRLTSLYDTNRVPARAL